MPAAVRSGLELQFGVRSDVEIESAGPSAQEHIPWGRFQALRHGLPECIVLSLSSCLLIEAFERLRVLA
jgi:hypothetical protein